MKLMKNLMKWQNYVHYLILTGGIFFIHYLTDIWGIEKAAVDGTGLGWFGLFMSYAIGIFVVDTLIHFLFSIAPKPIQWKD